jgi:chromosome segregation ATPase
MAHEEDKQNQLREEALKAAMHEKRAHAEKTKVVDQLAKVREQFSSQRQELTAEVVGLQRELERCYLTEKTLRMEVDQLSSQLEELKKFSEGADAQVRMKDSQIEEKERQLLDAAAREGRLGQDLRDAEAQNGENYNKYLEASRQNQLILDQRKEALDREAKAAAEARQLQIENEKERQALASAEKDRDYLVQENAQLTAAREEVVYSLELTTKENQRLKDEQEKGKLVKVMGRYMIKKMREKLTVVQEAHKRMEEGHFDLHQRYVKENKKCEAIENELRGHRQREAVQQEHYRTQEEDAAKVTAENRLLLERVHQLGTSLDEHKKEVETLRNENVAMQAKLTVLKERSSLANAIKTLGPQLEGLKDLTSSNSGLASAIQDLATGLAHVPAEPAPAPALKVL